MQNRIDRLEGLVLSLMTNGNQAAGPAAAVAAISGSGSTESADVPIDMNGDDSMIREEQEGEDSEVEQVAKSMGIMKVESGKSVYVSDAHWYTILSDVGLAQIMWQRTTLLTAISTRLLRSKTTLQSTKSSIKSISPKLVRNGVKRIDQAPPFF